MLSGCLSCTALHCTALRRPRVPAVEGNLELMANQPSGPTSGTSVFWALPVSAFEESGYREHPDAPQWQRYESAGFVAAGYAW